MHSDSLDTSDHSLYLDFMNVDLTEDLTVDDIRRAFRYAAAVIAHEEILFCQRDHARRPTQHEAKVFRMPATEETVGTGGQVPYSRLIDCRRGAGGSSGAARWVGKPPV